MQPNEWIAQFQERLIALEQENSRLCIELQDCQCLLASQTRVAELDRVNALLQAKLVEEIKQAALAKLSQEIACEQEKAARERAAELAKVNQLLRRSLQALA